MSSAAPIGDINELIARIHGRMPCIVDAGDYDAWLGPEVTDPGKVLL